MHFKMTKVLDPGSELEVEIYIFVLLGLAYPFITPKSGETLSLSEFSDESAQVMNHILILFVQDQTSPYNKKR
jgi:hypothetical protein